MSDYTVRQSLIQTFIGEAEALREKKERERRIQEEAQFNERFKELADKLETNRLKEGENRAELLEELERMAKERSEKEEADKQRLLDEKKERQDARDEQRLQFKEQVTKVGGFVFNKLGGVLGRVEGLAAAFSIAGGVPELMAVPIVVRKTFDFVRSTFTTVYDFVKSFPERLRKGLEGVKSFFTGGLTIVKGLFKILLLPITTALSIIVPVITTIATSFLPVILPIIGIMALLVFLVWTFWDPIKGALIWLYKTGKKFIEWLHDNVNWEGLTAAAIWILDSGKRIYDWVYAIWNKFFGPPEELPAAMKAEIEKTTAAGLIEYMKKVAQEEYLLAVKPWWHPMVIVDALKEALGVETLRYVDIEKLLKGRGIRWQPEAEEAVVETERAMRPWWHPGNILDAALEDIRKGTTTFKEDTWKLRQNAFATAIKTMKEPPILFGEAVPLMERPDYRLWKETLERERHVGELLPKLEALPRIEYGRIVVPPLAETVPSPLLFRQPLRGVPFEVAPGPHMKEFEPIYEGPARGWESIEPALKGFLEGLRWIPEDIEERQKKIEEERRRYMEQQESKAPISRERLLSKIISVGRDAKLTELELIASGVLT